MHPVDQWCSTRGPRGLQIDIAAFKEVTSQNSWEPLLEYLVPPESGTGKFICVKLDAGGLCKFRWCHTANKIQPPASLPFLKGQDFLQQCIFARQSPPKSCSWWKLCVDLPHFCHPLIMVVQWNEVNLIGLKFLSEISKFPLIIRWSNLKRYMHAKIIFLLTP